MYVRVSTFEGPPEAVDEMGRQASELVVPALKEIDGYRGMLALADRQAESCWR